MVFLAAMAKARWVLAAVLVAAGCVLIPPQTSYAQDPAQNPPARVGRLALIDGTVSYHTADESYWQAARRNYPVTTGEAFWTEPGAHAALEVSSDRIYLDSSTELDVSALDDQRARFSLPQGGVFVALAQSGSQDSPYEVETARGVATLATPGRYEVVAGDTAHDSRVTVMQGSARIRGNGLDLELGAGEAV